MECKRTASLKRSYSDFEPFCKRRTDETSHIVEIHVPDFSKSDLKVQINNQGILTITGEHQLEGAKWSRFCKEIEVPKNCNTDDIRAKLGRSILTITMPKALEIEGPSKNASIGELTITYVGLLLAVLIALGAYAFGAYFANKRSS